MGNKGSLKEQEVSNMSRDLFFQNENEKEEISHQQIKVIVVGAGCFIYVYIYIYIQALLEKGGLLCWASLI